MRVSFRVGIALFLSTWLISCDSAPGPIAPPSPIPKVSDLSYSPAFIDLSLILPTDTVITVQISASLTVVDEDDNIQRVEYILRSPLEGEPVISNDVLLSSGGGRFEVDADVEFQVGAQGLYTLLVFAVDDAGNLSNQARGLINFGSSVPFGTAPIIEMIEAEPNPAVPGQTLKMIATVSDAEGLSNILRVLIGTANPPADDFSMFDDGSTSGDVAAGDGKFTAAFGIPPTQQPDTTMFYVQAFDRNGLSSAVDSLEVRVQ